MPKKKAPPRPRAAPSDATASPEETVNWPALVEEVRGECVPEDLGKQLLAIRSSMTRVAAHMFVIGEYLLEQKKETPHGEFGTWLQSLQIPRSTATKYMGLVRRIRRHTDQHGPEIPLSKLVEFVQGGGGSKKVGAKSAQNATGVAISPGDDAPDETASAAVEEAPSEPFETVGTVDAPTENAEQAGGGAPNEELETRAESEPAEKAVPSESESESESEIDNLHVALSAAAGAVDRLLANHDVDLTEATIEDLRRLAIPLKCLEASLPEATDQIEEIKRQGILRARIVTAGTGMERTG